MREPTSSPPGRNTLFLVVGFVVLGVALSFLLFGADLFGLGAGSSARLEPIPDISVEKREVAEVPDSIRGRNIGDLAPDFELRDLDDKRVALSDFRGRPVMINFWATWCPPCVVEMPEMQQIFEKYADDGLVILALNQQESAEKVRAFFYDELALTFTPLLDTNGDVAAAYGAYGVYPSSFFIDAHGHITAIHRGMVVYDQIEEYVELTLE